MKAAAYLRPAVPAVLGVVLLTCGGSSPTGNTPPTTSTTLSPTTTTMPVAQNLCDRLGFVPSPNTACARQSSGSFQSQVDAAISKTIAENAGIFENASGGIRIKNIGKYVVEVIKNVNDAGLCAGFDGEELGVKSSNDSNDQYDISTASGFVRRGDPAYQATCSPAAFPVAPPPPIPPPAGCSLPSSREVACGASTQSFQGDLNAAIDQVVKEHPEVFDTNRSKGTADGYAVRDVGAYISFVAAALMQRGFCARYDGEEMVVKRTNEYSDHYDILTGDNFIRRGNGQYAVSCYPAAF